MLTRAVLKRRFLAYAIGHGTSATLDVPALGSAASHHVDVRLHGALTATLGLLAIFLSPLADRSGTVAIIGCAALLGGLPSLYLAPRRISPLSLTVGHMVASMGNCVLAVIIGHVMDYTAGPVIIIIVILHAACFRSKREAWFQLGWALTWYGVLLRLNTGSARAFGAWCVLAVTLVLLAGIVTQLRERVDLLVAELRFVAEHDQLTGLLNRQGLRRRLDEREGADVGSHDLVGVLLIDVDHFKRINDGYGHSAGDDALAWLGAQLITSSSPQAIVSRHGGEEFLIVVPIASAEVALSAADHIRRTVQEESRTQPHPLTVSIGVATGSRNGDFNGVIRRADTGLYLAKGAGRNRVSLEEQSPQVHGVNRDAGIPPR